MFASALNNNIASLFDTQWCGVTPLADANQWLRNAQRKITELKQLPENWDSYGSRTIQQAAIEQAGNLLARLSKLDLPRPQIFPVPGGGIQFEFRQDRRELELEILPDGSIEFLIVINSSEMREGAIPSGSLGEIYRLAYWLQGKQVAAYQFESA
ncbi:MAG: hypothetical protein ACREEM_11110 [Blastocatellia bacterium]